MLSSFNTVPSAPVVQADSEKKATQPQVEYKEKFQRFYVRLKFFFSEGVPNVYNFSIQTRSSGKRQLDGVLIPLFKRYAKSAGQSFNQYRVSTCKVYYSPGESISKDAEPNKEFELATLGEITEYLENILKQAHIREQQTVHSSKQN